LRLGKKQSRSGKGPDTWKEKEGAPEEEDLSRGAGEMPTWGGIFRGSLLRTLKRHKQWKKSADEAGQGWHLGILLRWGKKEVINGRGEEKHKTLQKKENAIWECMNGRKGTDAPPRKREGRRGHSQG